MSNFNKSMSPDGVFVENPTEKNIEAITSKKNSIIDLVERYEKETLKRSKGTSEEVEVLKQIDRSVSELLDLQDAAFRVWTKGGSDYFNDEMRAKFQFELTQRNLNNPRTYKDIIDSICNGFIRNLRPIERDRLSGKTPTSTYSHSRPTLSLDYDEKPQKVLSEEEKQKILKLHGILTDEEKDKKYNVEGN